MSDRANPTELNAEALGGALRGLPLATPPGGGWETLAASLRAQGLVRDTDAGDGPVAAAAAAVTPLPRRAAPRWLPYALAAGLGLFAVLLSFPTQQGSAPSPNPGLAAQTGAAGTTAAAPADLAQLRAESARIEEWLRLLRADETPLDGRSLMAATEIEDMIGLIDLQLAAGSDAGSDAAALWRERVELLHDLAAVRTTYSLAGTGIAANGTAAAPDNWTPL